MCISLKKSGKYLIGGTAHTRVYVSKIPKGVEIDIIQKGFFDTLKCEVSFRSVGKITNIVNEIIKKG